MEYGYYDPAQYAVTVPPGNNPYGSQGALKCEQCRTRRKKVRVPSLSVSFHFPSFGLGLYLMT